MKKVRVLLMIALFCLFISPFLKTPALASNWSMTDGMTWGRWIVIDEGYYRQCYPPGPRTMGVSFYVSMEGELYSKSVLSCGGMVKIENPKWLKMDGIGLAPRIPIKSEKSAEGFISSPALYSQMSWGNWVRIEGKVLREVFPPGGRLLGAQWYSDTNGNCYTRPVVPDGRLKEVESPDWFELIGMGEPPAELLFKFR